MASSIVNSSDTIGAGEGWAGEEFFSLEQLSRFDKDELEAMVDAAEGLRVAIMMGKDHTQ